MQTTGTVLKYSHRFRVFLIPKTQLSKCLNAVQRESLFLQEVVKINRFLLHTV